MTTKTTPPKAAPLYDCPQGHTAVRAGCEACPACGVNLALAAVGVNKSIGQRLLEIVAARECRVEVVSRPKHGSTFAVDLPIASPARS